MNLKSALLACAAAILLAAGPASAQMPDPPPDENGYYNPGDHDGYYGRDGRYRHFPPGQQFEVDEEEGPPPSDQASAPPRPLGPPPGTYREGDYERDCRGGTAAGTIFGAAGGGLIGGVASHGNPAAIVGGVILGGLFGHAISRDMDCEDHRYAFNVYDDGLNGEIGRRYEWRHGEHYGYFTPTREYTDDGLRCRDFIAVSYRDGREYERSGTACYQGDGYWHFRD
jgi:surface antigen